MNIGFVVQSHTRLFILIYIYEISIIEDTRIEVTWLNCLEFLSFLDTEQYSTILQNQFFTPLSHDCSKKRKILVSI